MSIDSAIIYICFYLFSGTKLLLSLLSAKQEMINKVIGMFNSVKNRIKARTEGFGNQF